MPPEDQIKKIENQMTILRDEFNLSIQEHEHDGNHATQVKTRDLFDTGQDLNITRYLQAVAIAFTTDATVADGHHYFHIPRELEGFYLTEVHAEVITAGVTGTLDIQIDKNGGTDMLSTVLTIDSGETGSDTAAAPAVINLSNDQVSENDVIRIDTDAIHSGTASKGLLITLGFQEFRE